MRTYRISGMQALTATIPRARTEGGQLVFDVEFTGTALVKEGGAPARRRWTVARTDAAFAMFDRKLRSGPLAGYMAVMPFPSPACSSPDPSEVEEQRAAFESYITALLSLPGMLADGEAALFTEWAGALQATPAASPSVIVPVARAASLSPISVSIPAPRQASGHTEYQVAVTVRRKGGEDSWSVWRRYSDFEKLHDSLKESHPGVMAPIPFPPKAWIGNDSPAFIEQRRQELEQYLQAVIMIDGITEWEARCGSPALAAFLQVVQPKPDRSFWKTFVYVSFGSGFVLGLSVNLLAVWAGDRKLSHKALSARSFALTALTEWAVWGVGNRIVERKKWRVVAGLGLALVCLCSAPLVYSGAHVGGVFATAFLP